MSSAITNQKRQALLDFIQRNLAAEPAIQAVVGIGSIATGQMRTGSDIDAILFFDPFDPYIVPAEFIWRPSDGSFHSIFSREPAVQEEGIQFDFIRVDLQEWSAPDFVLPEGRRAELSEGWLAFAQHNTRGVRVRQWISERTAYTDTIRMQRLDDTLIWLDQHLNWDTPAELWQSLGAAVAHDRLHAAYDYLVQGLFAYNQRWRPWRNREISYLLKLSWLPNAFAERVLTAMNAPNHEYTGYHARFTMLRSLFDELLAQVVADKLYTPDDPVGEAFVRQMEEPGRAWNMAEWQHHHQERSLRLTTLLEQS